MSDQVTVTLPDLPPEAVRSSQVLDCSSFQHPLTDADIAGYDAVIVKATEGTGWLDPTFSHNWAFLSVAVRAGKLKARGAYHFFHPSVNVAAQAAFFLATVAGQGLKPGDMLVADVEILSGDSNELLLVSDRRTHLLKRGRHGEAMVRQGADGYPAHLFAKPLAPLPASAVNSASRQFLDEVAAGVKVVLGGAYCPVLCYTDLSVGAQLTSCTGYELWVAYYAGHAPSSVAPWPRWVFWQFAGGGARNGGDQDAFNGTTADLQAWLASHVTPPVPTPTPANWTEALITELPVLSLGATGEDVRTLQGLLASRGHAVVIDGDFGPGTRTAVTAFQSARGLAADGVAGQKTWTAALGR